MLLFFTGWLHHMTFLESFILNLKWSFFKNHMKACEYKAYISKNLAYVLKR